MLIALLAATACGGASKAKTGAESGNGAEGGRGAAADGGTSNGEGAHSGLAGQTGGGVSGSSGSAGYTASSSGGAAGLSNGSGGAAGLSASGDGGVAGNARAGAGDGGRVTMSMGGVGGVLQACMGSVDCTGEVPPNVGGPIGSFPYGQACSNDGDYCSGSIHADFSTCLPWYALCCSGTWAQLSAASVSGARRCPTAGAGGAAGQGGEAGSAGQRAVACTGSAQYFPDFDRSCATDDDCAAVIHQTNCCGSEAAFGIRASELPAFNTAEATCDQQYPACGCASFGIDVEDETRVDFGAKDKIAVACDAGVCKARYSGASFACGTLRCIENQYCQESSGGPVGTATSYACNPSACTDCSCLTTASCSCSGQAGQLTLSCQGE